MLPFAKSRFKEIPQYILNSTGGIIKAFVGSFFSAEGHVSKINLEITSTSQQIIDALQILLLRSGIHSCKSIHNSVYKNEPYVSYRLYICKREDILKFKNIYKDYICPSKIKSFDNLKVLANAYNGERWLVPKDFIRPITRNYNLNAIFGTPNRPGGSIYNKNLSYEKATLLNSYIDSEILTTILNADYKFCKIKQVVHVGKMETYDFEVEGGNTPYGFVDGLLVHNSIGKKRADLMAEVKTKFLKGAKKADVVSKEQAEEIFSWIEKSNRYSFNKSHAVAYAMSTYVSAYMKTHFPLAFYAGWLYHSGHAPDPKVEVKELVYDGKMRNIATVSPNISRLRDRFNVDEGIIHFGLSDLKSIGASKCGKFFDVIENSKKIPQKLSAMSWYEFLTKVSTEDGVYAEVIKSLILTGSLDKYCDQDMTRHRMLEEFDVWGQLTKKERGWIQTKSDISMSLCDGIDFLLSSHTSYVCCTPKARKLLGVKRPIANDKRVEIVRGLQYVLGHPMSSLEDHPEWICQEEERYMGLSLTYAKVDCCDTSAANMTCKEYFDGYNGDCILAVEISTCKPYLMTSGPSKGKSMAFLSVEDGSGYLDSVIAFADQWDEFKGLLYKGNTVLLYGTPSKKDSSSLVIQKIKQI